MGFLQKAPQRYFANLAMDYGQVTMQLQFERAKLIGFFDAHHGSYSLRYIEISTQINTSALRLLLNQGAIAYGNRRLHGGKSGYYLANLRDKKYHYCGSNWQDVQETLLDLGIGKREVER
jgi:hypothetical protein